MILASKAHTAGNTTRWTLDYTRWLDNAATIVSAEITTAIDHVHNRPGVRHRARAGGGVLPERRRGG